MTLDHQPEVQILNNYLVYETDWYRTGFPQIVKGIDLES